MTHEGGQRVTKQPSWTSEACSKTLSSDRCGLSVNLSFYKLLLIVQDGILLFGVWLSTWKLSSQESAYEPVSQKAFLRGKPKMEMLHR